MYWLIVLVLIPMTVSVGCLFSLYIICKIAGFIYPKKEVSQNGNSK